MTNKDSVTSNYDCEEVTKNVDYKLELRQVVEMYYGKVYFYDYEEGSNKCYLRFLKDSTIYVAEKLKGGKAVNFYMLTQGVVING